MKRLVPFAVAILGFAPAACLVHRAPSTSIPLPKIGGEKRVLFSLKATDFLVGTGAPLAPRQCIFAHYTGWLTNGKKFDSSRDSSNGRPGQPLGFAQGARRVIAGWDAGFEGMKVGGRRRLFIPYQLAYGERGSPPDIPPKADLIFDVELMAVADTLPRAPAAPGGGGGGGRGGAAGPQCPTWSAVSAKKAGG